MAVAPTAAGPLAPWAQPVPGRWTFWADRIDGSPLGPLSLASMTFSVAVSKYGSGEGVVVLDESLIERADILRLWSWRLWVLLEGQPYWAGLPSSVRDDAGAAISLGFTELHGYLSRRVLDDPVRYDQVEQTEIARQIAEPVNDVGVAIAVDPGPGFLRDRSYAALEGPYRSNLLENLSNVISGPEYRMEYSGGEAARPSAVLRIAYPRLGTGASQLGLTLPGDAIGPALTYDGEKLRTRTYAMGDLPEHEEGEEPTEPSEPGEPPEQQERPVVIEDRPQAMVPRLDFIDEWPGVVLIETLTERAQTNAVLYAQPAFQISATTLESDPPLDTYGLGDDVTVHVTDRFHAGLSVVGRLVGMDIDCGAGTVGWTVAIPPGATPTARSDPGEDPGELPPVELRPTVTGRIDDLSRRTGAIFRRPGPPRPPPPPPVFPVDGRRFGFAGHEAFPNWPPQWINSQNNPDRFVNFTKQRDDTNVMCIMGGSCATIGAPSVSVGMGLSFYRPDIDQHNPIYLAEGESLPDAAGSRAFPNGSALHRNLVAADYQVHPLVWSGAGSVGFWQNDTVSYTIMETF